MTVDIGRDTQIKRQIKRRLKQLKDIVHIGKMIETMVIRVAVSALVIEGWNINVNVDFVVPNLKQKNHNK